MLLKNGGRHKVMGRNSSGENLNSEVILQNKF